MASSTLVNVAEHAELRLVRVLAELSPDVGPSFETDCEQCISNADAPSLIRAIVGNQRAVAALFALEYEEAISAFSLLAAMLDRIREDSPEEEAALAQELSQAVGENEFDVQKRLGMLCALYNLRAEGKCTLLTHIVRLAASADPSLLEEGTSLGKVLDSPQLIVGASKADRRGLYQAAADGIPDSVSRKQRFVLLIVESYEDKSEVDAEGIARAKEAAIGAIRDPVTLHAEQRGMLLLPAVRALEGNAGTAQLFHLMKIFQHGKLDDYEEFVAKHPSVIQDNGLSADECIRNMRLLSLCSLASEHEEIPYSAIASTLEVDPEEVESWVIQGVSSGLLTAKMDQLSQVVMVERCVVRQFGVQQWKSLQTRLNLWKKNVRGLVDGLKRSQAGNQQPV